MKRSSVMSLLLLVSLGFTANADVVHLRDGRVLEGETEWTESGDLRIRLAQGELIVPKADVREVIERKTPAEELAQRRKQLDPQDVDGVLALSAYARDHGLDGEARSLLLYAAALAPERAEVKAGLEALDFHFEQGRWVPPEEWYPQNGYVRWRGGWITAREAALHEAQRERRQARTDLRDAEQAVRSTERERTRARQRLTSAEREVDTGRARVDHYVGEVKRILALVEHAQSEVAQTRDRLIALEAERLDAIRTYDLWIASPCGCQPRQCACGWDRRRLYFLNACALLDQQVTDARRAARRAEERLDAAKSDLQRAEALLAKAKRDLADHEAARERAEREWGQASERHDAARQAETDAELRLDAAQAPAPAEQPTEAARVYPERPLLSAAIQAYRQPRLDEAGRGDAIAALERALTAGKPQPLRTVLTRFVHAIAGAPAAEVDAARGRVRGLLDPADREAFDRVWSALQGVDALAQVAAAQARHQAEHQAYAPDLGALFVATGRRFGAPVGYTLKLVGDARGWLAVATPRQPGLPYLARTAVGGTVARLDAIPLDLAAGAPRELEPLPPLE